MINALTASALLGGSFGTPPTGPAPPRALSTAEIARLAPWDQRISQRAPSDLARETMASTRLIDRVLSQGAGSRPRDDDDRTLFTIHQTARALWSLASEAADAGTRDSDRTRFADRFSRGLAELNGFLDSADLDRAVFLKGRRLSKLESVALPRPETQYVGKPVLRGDPNLPVEALSGDIRFRVTVTSAGVPKNIDIDLAGMGAEPRTISAVAAYVNGRLEAEGVASRLTRATTPPPAGPRPDGVPPPASSHGFQIRTGSGESVRFSAAAGDTRPAVFIAATEGAGAAARGVLTKLTDPATSDTPTFRETLEAGDKTTGARAVARGPDGALYVVGPASGKTEGGTPKAGQDVAITKFDSTGKKVWTRLLGSAASADGFAISVGANGTIAVAGSVNGRMDAGATGGAKDSFVAAFDSAGRDLWSVQRGAALDDEATSVAVADDGTVYVGGRTRSSIGGQAVSDGQAGYVQAFSASGTVQFTRTFDGAGDQGVSALAVSGGQVFVGMNDAGSGAVRRLDAGTGALDAGFTINTGDLGGGRLAALAVSGGRLVIGGETGGQVLGDGQSAVDGRDGFLAGFDATTGAQDFVRRIGGAGAQGVTGIAMSGGTAVAVGVGPGTGADAGRAVMAWGFDPASGAQGWTRQVAARGNAVTSAAVAIAPAESRSLAAMGLPDGEVRLGDVARLTDRTALRAGDHFFVKVNDGAPRRVSIEAGDTMRTLAQKVTRAMSFSGRAEARSGEGGDRIQITPTRSARIEVIAGQGPADALAQIGLSPGVADPRAAVTGDSSGDALPVVALDFKGDLSLADRDSAAAAVRALESLMRNVRTGWRETTLDPTQVEARRMQKAQSGPGAASASIAYLRNQAAGMQAALQRLSA